MADAAPTLWENVATGLGAGASAAAVLVAVVSSIGLLRKIWARSAGRRRAQARILDQLTCGSALRFVESLLGVPQFVSSGDGLDQRTYSLPGAWVMAEYDGEILTAFSMTIRSRRMWYQTSRLTFGHICMKLGKDAMAKLPSGALYSWMGAHTYGVLSYHYFGNPGGYQDYWVSHNMAGVGQYSGLGLYRSGEYGSEGVQPDLSKLTGNTLTVLGPSGASLKDSFMKREVLGPHHDLLRLAGYWIPSRWRRFVWKFSAILTMLRGER